MAKSKTSPDRLTLTFDLSELPTTQHRAGLAGLILQIDSMGPKGYGRPKETVPEIEELTATTARITFTATSMQAMFDELYEAKLVEVVVAAKWANVEPKAGEYYIEKKVPKPKEVKSRETGSTGTNATDPESHEVKLVPGFAYDVVQPQSPFLAHYLQPESRKAWLGLWRQMVWEVTRGGNNVRARAPFNERAEEKSCGEGGAAWSACVDFKSRQEKGQSKATSISGALMLGAQAVNAEGIAFSGRVDHNLLLHFWQNVVMTFVPYSVNREGKQEKNGYVLAIPDVADLEDFRADFPDLLGRLKAKPNEYTPSAARIDLPGQANLEMLRGLRRRAPEGEPGRSDGVATTEGEQIRTADVEQAIGRAVAKGHGSKDLRELSAAKAHSVGWGASVRAVESFHVLKQGNNIKLLTFTRVSNRPGLIEDYSQIVENLNNPLFRTARLRALLDELPWHSWMLELFAEYPWYFFLKGEDTPPYIPWFGLDARNLFRAFQEDIGTMSPDEMNDEERTQRLALILRRLVDKYVEGRAEAKTGKKVKDFPKEVENGKTRRVYPKDFRERQVQVCSDAFLAMRSRHDQDFVTYFAGSICSVAQYIPPADFEFLTGILMTNPDPNPTGPKRLSWEDVKAIAMIAVSACSFNVSPRDNKKPEGSNA
jgi:hypothetical protein